MLLGTQGAVLHHSAGTVLCFRNLFVLLSCLVVLLSCLVRVSAAGKDDLPMVQNGPRVPSTIFLFCLMIKNFSVGLQVQVAIFKLTSKVAVDVVRAKAKMQNILSRKSLDKTKQIQPCFLTYYTTSPKIWSTTKTFRNHLKIARNTKNQRGT